MNRQVRPADFATPVSPWRALIQRAGAGMVTIGVIAVAVLIGLALWNSPLVQGDDTKDGSPDQTQAGEQDTLLWVRTNLSTGKAEGLTLFGKSSDLGTQVLFIPTGVYSLIPGIGTDQLGNASQYGGAELMAAAVENLMGIHLDTVVSASSEDIAAWIQAGGGVQVDVPTTLTSRSGSDGTRKIIDSGDQFMTGPEVMGYLSLIQQGETEIDTFTRREVVWKALAKVLAKEDVAKTVLGDQPPHLTIDRDTALVRPILSSLAEERTTYSVLPVKPVGNRSGEETHYSPDWTAIRTMTERRWAGSLPEGSTGAARPIQILNGVGEPGVGQKVDARLAGLNLRVVVSENADTFSRQTTEVVVYADDAQTRKLGEEIVAKLGVGRLVKSTQPQSVVDVSIVVGADFLAAEAQRAAEAEAAAKAEQERQAAEAAAAAQAAQTPPVAPADVQPGAPTPPAGEPGSEPGTPGAPEAPGDAPAQAPAQPGPAPTPGGPDAASPAAPGTP
ncbi:LCP family protein [Stomatohabitans albus]|uniref:LCP family protein n=1 Tax=Stomatohabitans albus TaxID=3110766 RepID=UPI00300D74B3